MFDLIPNLIASLLTILFPIFASYKALRTSDPAQLSPWLMYWVSFGLVTLFEFYTYFLLSWIPFYGFFRLIFLSYLVLPQTQGARTIYQQYIHPFLAHHEARIEEFIGDMHANLKGAGAGYINQLVDFIKKNVFGIQVIETPKTNTSSESYVQNLLSRFNLPTAREGLAAPAGDFYGLLSVAANVIGNRYPSSPATRELQVEELSKSGSLIPQNITGTTEKADFISAQRERLRVVLGALDQAASGLEIEKHKQRVGSSTEAGLQKSKSEASFDTIEKSEVDGSNAGTGGWMNWAFSPKNNTAVSSGVEPQ